MKYLNELKADSEVTQTSEKMLLLLHENTKLMSSSIIFNDNEIRGTSVTATKNFMVRLSGAAYLMQFTFNRPLDKDLFENRLMDHFIKIGSLPCNNIFDIIQLHKFIENI